MDGVATSVQPGNLGVSTGGAVDLLGQPYVMATSGRGFNPAELAEMFVNKLLAVSIDLSGIVISATEHHFTRQTSYLTPALSGDHAADTSGSAFTQTVCSAAR